MGAAVAGSYMLTAEKSDSVKAKAMLSESLYEASAIPDSLSDLPREFIAAKNELDRLVLSGKASLATSFHEIEQGWKAR
jgi:hypothetical protein